MKCPHCLVAFHDKPEWVSLGNDKDGDWAVVKMLCPACSRMIVFLANGEAVVARSFFTRLQNVTQMILVRPKGSNRPPCPEEVKAASASIAADYEEACLVLPDSAKAS